MKYISANFQIIIFINLFILILSNDETEIIPEFFDCRIKWPKCIPKISDQGSCGACYAMSVSTAFSATSVSLTSSIVASSTVSIFSSSVMLYLSCFAGKMPQ